MAGRGNPNLKPRWKKGESGNPAGRKSKKEELTKIIYEKIKSGEIKSPLEFMLALMLNPHAKMDDRKWGAAQAAPYCHKRMPIAIEGGDRPLQIFDVTQLNKLSTVELKTLMGLLAKVGVSTTAEITTNE